MSSTNETFKGENRFGIRVHNKNVWRIMINIPKSDIAESKIQLQPEPAQGSSKNPSAEPTKHQKICTPEKLEESGSEKELQLQPQQADPFPPNESFQHSIKRNRRGRGTELGGKTGQTDKGWTKFSKRARDKKK